MQNWQIINKRKEFRFSLCRKVGIPFLYSSSNPSVATVSSSGVITSARYGEATITVSNQCDKIPEEKLKSLFGKFIRIDDKTTRTTRGTGLGLFIVKGLVEAMNGQIKISSTDEIGFKVDVTFKLFKSNQ